MEYVHWYTRHSHLKICQPHHQPHHQNQEFTHDCQPHHHHPTANTLSLADTGRTFSVPTKTEATSLSHTNILLGSEFHKNILISSKKRNKSDFFYAVTNVIVVAGVQAAGAELLTFIVYVVPLSPLTTVSAVNNQVTAQVCPFTEVTGASAYS